ncbi:cobalt/nickel transport system ATP-binding protein [Thermostichus sp. MS-CIW-21]|jgi:cobalt/nickel transport system ATP-binding protein|uniref:energy-coupling factor ABC transporter ATP-binding protein n=1 Tax=unclassified Synechococcus TaxID=2626047 RepID=UPI00006944A4|nr:MULTISPECIES: ABC transporter ATP-binding protein [unclassified Synechococcus]ABC99770.1 putative cobalt ABC transporter (CoT) family, ATP-binding protein [Synechococcus sp. JA-3-3Ab]PIK87290.1 cobalt ABC transporter ATP-binding protein [Synechococcus sp. 63AY4M2]PIK88213.1 cobalt ABC transporter ATP-binding protein [Synechococcus sp. 65AY6A5]PIK92645.1 cobalt ABC transporter ATP-binding protein [Synechococcus sp. 65AY6Li]PIK94002.1 cobalt ABC transporter ATP-binding protein [Synechococcus 
MNTAPAVEVKQLWVAYPGCPPVLQGLDLRVEAGQRLGIIGPNGAGKTTLFLALAGLLPPCSGQITLFGQPLQPGQFRPEVGLVFQDPDDQLFAASVAEDVAFGPRNLGRSETEVAAVVQATLAMTGTLNLANCPPHHLSGGEKRMVAIAGILAMQPQLVLYDEPTANLDLRARRRLIAFLLQATHTFLLASHDLELILEVCDRVILLDQGRICAQGSPAHLMSQPDLMEAHDLEVPPSLRR